MSLLPSITERIVRRGPMTVAEFMDHALYDPERGYYSSAAQRSGRAGDFYTSVDVGPLFGELLATLVAGLWPTLRDDWASDRFRLVEAAAGNGRLMRDVLDALASESPECYAACDVVLVERSDAARAEQAKWLGPHADRVQAFTESLPTSIRGIVFANELLDAMPFHRVRATETGWRETYVDVVGRRLVLREGALSDPELARYFDRVGIEPEDGQVADISLDALRWMGDCCRAVEKGYILLMDYGQEASELFSLRHRDGTLRSYTRHLVDPPASSVHGRAPAWLSDPGERDITAHVDFTSIRLTAEAEGCRTLACCDQTRFLTSLGLADRLARSAGNDVGALRRRLAAKALVMPGGLGSTHRALLAAKGVSDLPGDWRPGR